MTYRMTVSEVAAHQRRVKGGVEQVAGSIPAPSRRQANKTELAYGQHLELQRRSKIIDWYRFEGLRLKLADGAWFKPDFAVLRDGTLEFHETKGFMREAANVRLKVAADQYPFKFYLVRATDRSLQSWNVQEVG